MGDDPYGRGELLFARKFPDDSSQLTDFIDAHIINRRDQQSEVSDTVVARFQVIQGPPNRS